MSSNDDTLISKLISETYTETSDKDQPNAVVDLRNYFEKKLNEVEFISIDDYLLQHNLQISELTMQENTKCYRLVYNKAVLDFPSNWSVFKEIKTEEVVFVNQELDQDYLLDIFSELTGTFNNLLLIKENEEVKIIYLSEESSRDHVKWFRGFFEKKKQTDHEEEAA